jgi:carboxypeptidase Taq
VPDALEQLKQRAAEIRSLRAIANLLDWDQLTIMPPAGAHHRGEHMALILRLAHQRLIDPEVGRLLDELGPVAGSLDPDSDDAGLVRLMRWEYDKAVRVPAELQAEMARAAAEANGIWKEAKATSNFELFLPSLEHIFELRRRYIGCFDPVGEPYDVLLDDYEPGLTTADITRTFDEIKRELVPLIAELRDSEVDDAALRGPFPVDRQVALSEEIVAMFGYRPATYRIDPTEHPFASGAGIDDIRVTTHYYEHDLSSLFTTMHEYGHGLYEHQISRRIAHLPTGIGWLSGLHESQSRLWENLVGRSHQFWRFFYPRLQEVFPEALRGIELDRFYGAINRSQPSLIRIRADEVTYGMHVIMRFELEQDIVNGRIELRDLPAAWAAKVDEYLGLEVPDDARGVLQDMHWSGGLIGYFATYLLGSIMSVQFWNAVTEQVGDLEDRIERGDFATLREWLGENVHTHGRKFFPGEILRRATGSELDPKPYLAYLKQKYGSAVAA